VGWVVNVDNSSTASDGGMISRSQSLAIVGVIVVVGVAPRAVERFNATVSAVATVLDQPIAVTQMVRVDEAFQSCAAQWLAVAAVLAVRPARDHLITPPKS
jgi:hypothetical protein